MGLSIAQLRAAKTSFEIDEAISLLSLPDGMDIEEFIIQLLDTYFNAQEAYNLEHTSGSQIEFVKAPTISNPKITGIGATYSVDKSYVVRARVNTKLDTVEPILQ